MRQEQHAADITIVLDRSGSMGRMKDQTIESFNTFLVEQRGVAGDAAVTLVQFDHEYEPLFEGRALPEVPDLTHRTYRPRGRTALLDAIGRTVVRTGHRLDDAIEPPELVVFVILTDGYENASVEYDRRQIFDMISQRTSRYGWQFVFLGANQDAIREARGIGIAPGMAMDVGSSRREYLAANRILRDKVVNYRRSGRACDLEFTPEERKQAKQ